jgi:hypothetical protein
MKRFSEFVDEKLTETIANAADSADEMQEPAKEYSWMKDPTSKSIFLILRRAWDLMRLKRLAPEEHIDAMPEMIYSLASGRRSITGSVGINTLVNRATPGAGATSKQMARRFLTGNRA